MIKKLFNMVMFIAAIISGLLCIPFFFIMTLSYYLDEIEYEKRKKKKDERMM